MSSSFLRCGVFSIALGLLLVACGGDEADSTLEPIPSARPEPIGELLVRIPEPLGIDFTPDGRMFYIARQRGEIRWYDLNQGVPERAGEGELFAKIEVFPGSECGILGSAIDPGFEENGFVYVYATEPDPEAPENAGKPRVIRFRDQEGLGVERTSIIDDLPFTNPETCAHVGGTLKFGPDGFLYLSLGNNERKQTSDDLTSPLGKILRFSKDDGSAAADNPFVNNESADPRIFAYGFRNPFAFAFHPQGQSLYVADNGPGNCDELNLVSAGGFYGAPGSLPRSDTESCLELGGSDPIYLFATEGKQASDFPSNVAPSGLVFVTSDLYPTQQGSLLVCEFLSEDLRLISFANEAGDAVTGSSVLLNGCRFAVTQGADGMLYYASRDAIWRLPPAFLP